MYTRHLLERIVSKCSKNISGLFHKSKRYQKRWPRASNRTICFKPLYTTESRTTNHVALIVDLWSPIRHMQSIELNTIKTQYGKETFTAEHQRQPYGLLCFVQVWAGPVYTTITGFPWASATVESRAIIGNPGGNNNNLIRRSRSLPLLFFFFWQVLLDTLWWTALWRSLYTGRCQSWPGCWLCDACEWTSRRPKCTGFL